MGFDPHGFVGLLTWRLLSDCKGLGNSAVSVLPALCEFCPVESRADGLVGRSTFMVRPREAFVAEVGALESGFESRLQDPQTPALGVVGWSSIVTGGLTGSSCVLGSAKVGWSDSAKSGFRSSSNSPKETLAEAGADVDCRGISLGVGWPMIPTDGCPLVCG